MVRASRRTIERIRPGRGGRPFAHPRGWVSRPLPARLELQGEELEHARIVAERRGLSLEELVKSLVEQAYQAQQAGQPQFQQTPAEAVQAA